MLDMVAWGYVSPNYPWAPMGFYWQARIGGWALLRRGGSASIAAEDQTGKKASGLAAHHGSWRERTRQGQPETGRNQAEAATARKNSGTLAQHTAAAPPLATELRNPTPPPAHPSANFPRREVEEHTRLRFGRALAFSNTGSGPHVPDGTSARPFPQRQSRGIRAPAVFPAAGVFVIGARRPASTSVRRRLVGATRCQQTPVPRKSEGASIPQLCLRGESVVNWRRHVSKNASSLCSSPS